MYLPFSSLMSLFHSLLCSPHVLSASPLRSRAYRSSAFQVLRRETKQRAALHLSFLRLQPFKSLLSHMPFALGSPLPTSIAHIFAQLLSLDLLCAHSHSFAVPSPPSHIMTPPLLCGLISRLLCVTPSLTPCTAVYVCVSPPPFVAVSRTPSPASHQAPLLPHTASSPPLPHLLFINHLQQAHLLRPLNICMSHSNHSSCEISSLLFLQALPHQVPQHLLILQQREDYLGICTSPAQGLQTRQPHFQVSLL